MGNLIMKNKKVFECRCCGTCCQGQGGIFIPPEEAAGLARILGLRPEEFIELFTTPKHGLLSIKTDEDGFCLLLDREKNICRVHEVKPVMCRDWPFFYGPLKSRQGFEEARVACPGINPDIDWEDFVEYHRTHIRTMPPITYLKDEKKSDSSK